MGDLSEIILTIVGVSSVLFLFWKKYGKDLLKNIGAKIPGELKGIRVPKPRLRPPRLSQKARDLQQQIF